MSIVEQNTLNLIIDSLKELKEDNKIQRADMKALNEQMHETSAQVNTMAGYVAKINDLAKDIRDVGEKFQVENKEVLERVSKLKGSELTILNLISNQEKEIERVKADFKILKEESESKDKEHDEKLELFNAALTELNNKAAKTAWKTMKHVALGLLMAGLIGGLGYLFSLFVST